jgi:hypothetical protein
VENTYRYLYQTEDHKNSVITLRMGMDEHQSSALPRTGVNDANSEVSFLKTFKKKMRGNICETLGRAVAITGLAAQFGVAIAT